jgi:hypothetical protein
MPPSDPLAIASHVPTNDGDGLVIIESQLEKTRHNHLGQIIAHTAGIKAKKVIWIADSFRPEHASALQLLNDNASEDPAFFAVEVDVCRSGHLPPASSPPGILTHRSRMKRAGRNISTGLQKGLSRWIASCGRSLNHSPHKNTAQTEDQIFNSTKICFNLS